FEQLFKRQEGKIYYLGNEVSKLFKRTDPLIGEALLSGDYETAIQLVESRLAQANLLLEEGIRHENPWLSKFKTRIAEEFLQLAQLYRLVTAGEKDDRKKRAAEHKAARAEMLAATYFGYDWRTRALESLRRVDHEKHPTMRLWKEQQLANLIASMPPAETLPGDSYVHALRLQILDDLFKTSQLREVKASALSLQAHVLYRQGRAGEAMEKARQGWELDKKSAMTAVTYLTLLANEKEPQIEIMMRVLSHVPLEHAQKYDRMVLVKLLSTNPTTARLEKINRALANNTFPPTRRADLELQVKAMLARAYAAEGNAQAKARVIIKEALNSLKQSSLPQEKKKKVKSGLENLLTASSRYERQIKKFDEGKLDDGFLFELFVSALTLKQDAAAERLLQAFVKAGGVDVATRLHSLAEVITNLAKVVVHKDVAEPVKKRAQKWIDRIRKAGEPMGKKEIEAVIQEMKPLQEDAKMKAAEVEENGPSWYDGFLWFFSAGNFDRDEIVEEKHKALADVMGRNQTMGHRAMRIQTARTAFLEAGKTGKERRTARIKESARVDALYDEARRTAWDRARKMTDGVPVSGSRDALHLHLAKLEVYERLVEAMKWREIEEANKITGDTPGGSGKSAGQIELDRLNRKRLGRDSSSRFNSDYTEVGERKQYLNFKSWKNWYIFDNKENEFDWKHDLLRARARRTEERVMRLIRSGPLVDPATGKEISLASRKVIEVDMLIDERKQLHRRYRRYESIPFMTSVLGGW
ncbi:MAG: hypothetical protein KAI25_13905, partial [Hyphomicrobiaceae bacterium]|nr:hypothetical protein [Hyphomicrobiaceae bacterium]